MERFVKTKRKTAYLYVGIGFAAMAFIMLTTSISSLIRGERLSVLITGFGAAVMWGVAAFACMWIYYKANGPDLSMLDDKNDSQDKT